MKFVRLFFISLIAFVSAGCANTPGGNILTGVGAGALFGAAVGDTTDAARRGAVLGGILGAMVPIQQNQPSIQQQQQPMLQGSNQMQPGYSCPNGSVWDGRGCRVGVVNQTFPTFPTPQQRMCDNPYRVNSQGQPVFNGRYPC